MDVVCRAWSWDLVWGSEFGDFGAGGRWMHGSVGVWVGGGDDGGWALRVKGGNFWRVWKCLGNKSVSWRSEDAT